MKIEFVPRGEGWSVVYDEDIIGTLLPIRHTWLLSTFSGKFFNVGELKEIVEFIEGLPERKSNA